MDAWFEEDDEVFVHPRDPCHRVDVLSSSWHVAREALGRDQLAQPRAAGHRAALAVRLAARRRRSRLRATLNVSYTRWWLPLPTASAGGCVSSSQHDSRRGNRPA
jgi:hypothetical protein